MKNLLQTLLGLAAALAALAVVGASLMASVAEGQLAPRQAGSPFNPPTVVPCIPPEGWQPYSAQAGDTLQLLADRAGVDLAALLAGNCRTDQVLPPGSLLYLPPGRPSATPCGPPPGWVPYTVQAGDSLTTLAGRLGISVQDLRSANCLSEDFALQPGSRLVLPATPTATASPTRTVTPTPLPSETPTLTPVP